MSLRLILLFLSGLIYALTSPSEAATRWANTTDQGAGDCTSSSNACDLQQALNAAVAGDTITVKNGIYTGHYTTNGGAGTSGAKVLIKAENRHGAIIQGNSSSSDGTTNEYAFLVTKAYYIIDGFEMRQHRLPIWANEGGAHLEVRFNLIHTFFGHGVWLQGGNGFVHENVIGQAYSTNTANSWAGIYLDNSHNHTAQRNIIFGVTNNRFIQVNGIYGTSGYPIFGYLSSNNLIQGNMMMDGAKNSGLRFSGDSCASATGPWASNNTIRDNIMGHGQGGGVGMAENARDSIITNNLAYGAFFVGLNAKGNDPGNIVFTHNQERGVRWQRHRHRVQ
jgi:Right handed beta helix region